MQNRILISILVLCCFCSCLTDPKQKKPTARSGEPRQAVEATGFTIQNFGSFQKLTVIDPWQKSTNTLFEYYLVERGKPVPTEIKDKQILYIPLQNVICLSTTHIGFLDALGEISSLKGISGSEYISNKEVRQGIAEKRIREVGYDRGLNYEMIVQLKPDVVFAYGVGSEINTQVNKLHDLGIQVVLVGEYLEQSPLGKAEWIKFFGAFYNKGDKANAVYESVKNQYNNIKLAIADVATRPTVLTGLPFKDTWWIAGGQSNLAVLISDAGGKFLWSDNTLKEAFPVSLEEVFLKAAKADFWINCGSVNNLEGLLAFDPRFSELPSVKKMQVYNNNLRSTPAGGNDYWESGVMHPDLILSDLVQLFHPEILSGRELHYYKKVESGK